MAGSSSSTLLLGAVIDHDAKHDSRDAATRVRPALTATRRRGQQEGKKAPRNTVGGRKEGRYAEKRERKTCRASRRVQEGTKRKKMEKKRRENARRGRERKEEEGSNVETR